MERKIVSVGIPVVNRRFPTKSTARQNHPFARVSRRSGLSLWEPWMPLSTIPNQAPYQLGHTRLSRFHSPGSFRGFFVSVGIPVVNRKFPTKSNLRQSHPFARVSRRSGLSQPTQWILLSIVPNHPRYQLRYTRLTCYSSAQATFYHTRFRYAMLFSLRFAPVYAKLVSYLIFHH